MAAADVTVSGQRQDQLCVLRSMPILKQRNRKASTSYRQRPDRNMRKEKAALSGDFLKHSLRWCQQLTLHL